MGQPGCGGYRLRARAGGQRPGSAPEQPRASRAWPTSGLIVVGEATIEPALDKAFTGTAKVFKREMAATVDQITSELQEAFKG